MQELCCKLVVKVFYSLLMKIVMFCINIELISSSNPVFQDKRLIVNNLVFIIFYCFRITRNSAVRVFNITCGILD